MHTILQKLTNFVPLPLTKGDFEEMPMLSCQGVGLVKDIKPVGEIMETMMAYAVEIVSGLGQKIN